jgi:TPR repeat protein
MWMLAFTLLLQTAVPSEVAQLTRRAKAGDAKAEYALGLDYARGRGVPADDAQALKWFLKAAQQHNPEGEYALSELYLTGRGVPQDDAKATEWLKRAAQHGEPRAQYNLATFYLTGRGVAKDDALAFSWMQKAAQQRFDDGEFGLGSMYQHGTGVQRDDVKAAHWYRSAALQGSDDATTNLALLLATSSDPHVRNQKEALTTAQAAVDRHPDDATYLDTLASVYFLVGDAKTAADVEKRAVALKPNSEAYKTALAKFVAATH